ncbi:hypothetical protein [Streptomyces sp. NPDC020965]|uniref:hypothetical protein n=1 Tax=Streptomyces sp. NPDC020965 TaxID=3365105 RepID=UPI0037961A78
MSEQRTYGSLNRLMEQHQQMEKLSQGLHGTDPERALDRLILLMKLHERAESPVMKAARSSLTREMVTVPEENWRLLRQLTADMRGTENPPPDRVDKIKSMLYDHTIDLGTSIFAHLYLTLNDNEFSEMKSDILKEIASTDTKHW